VSDGGSVFEFVAKVGVDADEALTVINEAFDEVVARSKAAQAELAGGAPGGGGAAEERYAGVQADAGRLSEEIGRAMQRLSKNVSDFADSLGALQLGDLQHRLEDLATAPIPDYTAERASVVQKEVERQQASAKRSNQLNDPEVFRETSKATAARNNAQAGQLRDYADPASGYVQSTTNLATQRNKLATDESLDRAANNRVGRRPQHPRRSRA